MKDLQPGRNDSREWSGKNTEIFPADFLEALSCEFAFDAFAPEIKALLDEIPRKLNIARRLGDGREEIREYRKNFERLAQSLDDFLSVYDDLRSIGIDSEIWDGAKKLPGSDPNLSAKNYPEFIYKDSRAYEFELQRYLNFLQIGVYDQIKKLKTPTGRPKDQGLHLAVRHIANIWSLELKRPYTVDYHAGSGVSQAFAFTNRVVQQIEHTDERRVITAMRAVIKQNADLDQIRSQPHKNPPRI